MGAVIDEKMIVAIELELVEAKHKTLQDGLRLERDDAIEVRFVLRPQHSAIDFAVELLQKVVLAE